MDSNVNWLNSKIYWWKSVSKENNIVLRAFEAIYAMYKRTSFACTDKSHQKSIDIFTWPEILPNGCKGQILSLEISYSSHGRYWDIYYEGNAWIKNRKTCGSSHFEWFQKLLNNTMGLSRSTPKKNGVGTKHEWYLFFSDFFIQW